MRAFIEKLTGNFERELAVHCQEKQPLRRLMLCKRAAENAIHELHDFAKTYFIEDPEEIILYNKEWAPFFYAKLIYFNKCYDLECLCLSSGPEERKALMEHELAGVQHFFRRYSSFCHYYYSGNCDKDHFYWSREYSDNPMPDEIFLIGKPNVNEGRLLVAYLLANEQFRDFLQIELYRSDPTMVQVTAGTPAKWKDSNTDLAELIVCLYEEQAIEVDGQPATFEYYKDLCEKQWGVSLDALSVIDNKMRSRKKSTTPFMEKLTRKFMERKERLSGPSR
jgi:hypothetical protein